MGGVSKPLKEEVEDLSWGEVAKLSKDYLRIPLALILVEIFYWFITQPTNTLGPIQESEAWIWYHLTNLIYGPGTATLSDYQGWTTLVTLNNPDFYYGQIQLYVSDECAGVHEMLFITVLIMMTSGVPQRLRIRSALVACGLVYVLNIVRLLVLYPMAVSGCNENPNLLYCEQPMHDFHTFVYQWGFLLLMIIIWLVWFKWVNAGSMIQKANAREKGKWKFAYRRSWENLHRVALAISIGLIIGAAGNIMLDDAAMEAKEKADACDYFDSVDKACGEARDLWGQEIQVTWSLVTLGLIGTTVTIVEIDRPSNREKDPIVEIDRPSNREKDPIDLLSMAEISIGESE